MLTPVSTPRRVAIHQPVQCAAMRVESKQTKHLRGLWLLITAVSSIGVLSAQVQNVGKDVVDAYLRGAAIRQERERVELKRRSTNVGDSREAAAPVAASWNVFTPSKAIKQRSITPLTS